MERYNADGTRAEMCGNGIRCVAKFVYDKGLTDKTEITVESFGQVKYLRLFTENGRVKQVRVDMGEPVLRAEEIPVVCDGEQAVAEALEVEGRSYEMTCVSMGNPHAVVYMEDVAGLEIEKTGPFFENHPRFPRRDVYKRQVQELVSTVDMMCQSRERRRRRQRLAPRERSKEEEAIIKEAKALLMERNRMTEEEAHRYIQKCSMDSGTNMVEMAKMVLVTRN